MKKIRIFALVLVLGLVLVLSSACIKKTDVNQEIMPEVQETESLEPMEMESTEPLTEPSGEPSMTTPEEELIEQGEPQEVPLP